MHIDGGVQYAITIGFITSRAKLTPLFDCG